MSVKSGNIGGHTYSLCITAILEIFKSSPDTFRETIHLSASLRGIPKAHAVPAMGTQPAG